MHIASIGIDLGKTTFHLVALGERSKVVVLKKFSRTQLLAYTANLPSSLIGLEACSGAHFLGAALREQRPRRAAHPRPVARGICLAIGFPCVRVRQIRAAKKQSIEETGSTAPAACGIARNMARGDAVSGDRRLGLSEPQVERPQTTTGKYAGGGSPSTCSAKGRDHPASRLPHVAANASKRSRSEWK